MKAAICQANNPNLLALHHKHQSHTTPKDLSQTVLKVWSTRPLESLRLFERVREVRTIFSTKVLFACSLCSHLYEG